MCLCARKIRQTSFCRTRWRAGRDSATPLWARALCQDAAEIFDEIRAMGLSFNREKNGSYQALRPLGASWPRVVSIGNETGAAILTRLKETLQGSVTELSATRALKLLKDGSRVCGALAYDAAGKRWLNLRANAVVLACGGYCGIYPVSTNKRDSGGDGVAMAYEAGAELCDMEFIQFEPSAAVWPRELVGTSVITTLLFEGAVLRNRDGERFMLRYGPEGDRVSKDVMSRRIVAEIARGKGTEHGGIYMDITGVDPARLASGYQMYVQRYRNVGIDITKEWIELAPAPHTALGGVRVDAQGHSTVQGLFACGEVMGGLARRKPHRRKRRAGDPGVWAQSGKGGSGLCSEPRAVQRRARVRSAAGGGELFSENRGAAPRDARSPVGRRKRRARRTGAPKGHKRVFRWSGSRERAARGGCTGVVRAVPAEKRYDCGVSYGAPAR